VAQLAGLPKAVINRAGEILAELEEGSRAVVTEPPPSKPSPRRRRQKVIVKQMTFFGPKPPAVDELEKLDIDALTPLEALTKLYELQKKAREG
jgi:DNA mismatch repair protein MutS